MKTETHIPYAGNWQTTSYRLVSKTPQHEKSDWYRNEILRRWMKVSVAWKIWRVWKSRYDSQILWRGSKMILKDVPCYWAHNARESLADIYSVPKEPWQMPNFRQQVVREVSARLTRLVAAFLAEKRISGLPCSSEESMHFESNKHRIDAFNSFVGFIVALCARKQVNMRAEERVCIAEHASVHGELRQGSERVSCEQANKRADKWVTRISRSNYKLI